MQNTLYDIIIIGSGPAGLTAAIYTSRAELNTLVISGQPPGGQLMLTTEVENFPGFPEGIMGPQLIQNMREQAKRFGVTFADEMVETVEGSFEQNFTLKTNSKNEYKGKTVIVATGASARWLGLPSEQRLIGKGVSSCATCDGFFFKDKTIAVIGAGDSAMEEATFLTKFAKKVYVLVRKEKDQMKASKIMQNRALENEKIEFVFNTEVKEVLGEDFVNGLRVYSNKEDSESVMEDIQGLFLAIGHTPNTKFIENLVETDEHGYAQTQKRTMSKTPGIFVSGDVYDYYYRQAITAAGHGCQAALDAERFLAEHE